MPTYFTTLSQHDNYSGPTGTKFNFGPHSLSPCNKVMRVEAQIEAAIPMAGATATALVANPWIWGVQYGPAGYTPADIITNAFAANYLFIELMGGENFEHPVWSPNAATGQVGLVASAKRTWRGQLPVGANSDFYVSIGNNFVGPQNIVAHSLLRILSD